MLKNFVYLNLWAFASKPLQKSQGPIYGFFLALHNFFLGLHGTKPVFGVSNKGRLKPVSSATETN